MPDATEQTTKHFVDLWQEETVVWRKRLVIEAPSDWDASRLADLDSAELTRLAHAYGDGWDSVEVRPHEVEKIDISGPVPDDVSPDIVFRRNKVGDIEPYLTFGPQAASRSLQTLDHAADLTPEIDSAE